MSAESNSHLNIFTGKNGVNSQTCIMYQPNVCQTEMHQSNVCQTEMHQSDVCRPEIHQSNVNQQDI